MSNVFLNTIALHALYFAFNGENVRVVESERLFVAIITAEPLVTRRAMELGTAVEVRAPK